MLGQTAQLRYDFPFLVRTDGYSFRDVSLADTILFTLTVTLAWFISSSVRQYFRLRHFDGPLLAKISNLWLFSSVNSGRSYLDFWQVTQNYGTIARVGLNDLVTDDPAFVKHMCNVKTEYRRSSWYDGMRFNPTTNNCLSTRDEIAHSALRSKMAAGYAGRDVDNIEPKIDSNIRDFMRLLGSYADKKTPVDLGRKVQYFTLDVISDLAYGAPFGFVETDTDVYEYIQTTEKNLPMIMVVTVFPWLLTLLNSPVLKGLLPSTKDRLGFGRIMSIAKDVAAERFKPDVNDERDMLASFIRHGLTPTEAESEILLQIAAGSDTTASAIRSTMLQMCSNHDILHKLRREIASADIVGDIISDNEAKELPYLQAVIKEGLRIFPPIAGLMSKEVPPHGDTWNGVFIPGGTRVGYSIWAITRREDIWGADALDFQPERWLDNSPEKVKEMEGTLDLIFSYGRWLCLGRTIALIELNKIFVELIRRFDFTVCDPDKPWKVFNHGVFSQSQLWMHVTRTKQGE
ncbi:cytochrome P450 [Trichoderma parareesei]|uniref:Cytochrome P450 n=1 Tax=Trichoderma parareesei TaxID=858221 RepID=A0A2H2ZGX2_TRIPA|nr:cytochrome P450 [Trichoderma parareesei]